LQRVQEKSKLTLDKHGSISLSLGRSISSLQWEKSLKEIAGDAVLAALNDAGRDSIDLNIVWSQFARKTWVSIMSPLW
jgi:hypothetical protein